MKINLLLIAIIFSAFSYLNAQENANVYWVTFSDKDNNNYTLEEPENFLSQKSLERRSNQNISLTIDDLPVSNYYTDSLESIGIQIRYTSKWFNGAAIQSEDTHLIDTIENLGFVTSKKLIREYISTPELKANKIDNVFEYGLGENQISMLNGHILHNQGYSGQGMLIAVLDSGFPDIPSLSCFQEMVNEGRIISTRNFVSSSTDVYGYHSHGRAVLSIIGGKDSNNLIGTAPDADYILLRTEDASSEQLIEEYNWIAAAEYADSLGADLLSVSLGYRSYDNPSWSYELSDYDGNTAPISIAARIAARKGILVVVAAGNDGSGEQPTIGAPADADSVLTIGATDSEGNYASFSSIGYSADGRVKPDVVAQGQATFYQGSDGNISYGNGTSFSTPIMAGLTACLWQANPDMTNIEILQVIKESANKYNSPDQYMGYGIPDFAAANLALKNINYNSFGTEMLVNIFPNPTIDFITLDFYSIDTQKLEISIINTYGQTVFSSDKPIKRTTYERMQINEVSNFPAGLYIIHIKSDNKMYSRSFVKQ